jgi:hypothetical protein
MQCLTLERAIVQETVLCNIALGERAVASDPSYGMDVWCGEYDIPVKAGQYTVRQVRGQYKGWGERTARIIAQRNDETVTEWTFLNGLGVDSARMAIWNAETYEGEENERDTFEPGQWERMLDTMTREEISANWPNHRISANGCWVSAGFGDGYYFSYLGKNAEGETVAISVVFLMKEEDENQVADDPERGIPVTEETAMHPALLQYAGGPASVWN